MDERHRGSRNYVNREEKYAVNIDYGISMGLGFKFETQNLYGLPQRK